MTFGSPPRFSLSVIPPFSDNRISLAFLVSVCQELRWSISEMRPGFLLAYSENSRSEIRFQAGDGQWEITSTSTDSSFFDWGRNKRNISAFNQKMVELAPTFSEEVGLAHYSQLQQHFTQEIPEDEDKPLSFSEILIPGRSLWVTPIVILLNLLVFILMVASGISPMDPDSESLLKWGALFRPNVVEEGEWWRLTTSNFLHIGAIHLFMNLYALISVGPVLEKLLGKTRYLAAYLLSGFSGSLCSLWWHEATISAGASGAIFGLYGLFLALLSTRLFNDSYRNNLLPSIGLFIGYNLLYGLRGSVDNAGHIGGLLGGMLIGYTYLYSLRNPADKGLRNGLIGILVFVFAALGYLVKKQFPTQLPQYRAMLERFDNQESLALAVFSYPEGTDPGELERELEKISMYYWVESKKLIEEADRLDISELDHKRNQLLKKYCDLRFFEAQELVLLLQGKSTESSSKVQVYRRQIKDLLEELQNLK